MNGHNTQDLSGHTQVCESPTDISDLLWFSRRDDALEIDIADAIAWVYDLSIEEYLQAISWSREIVVSVNKKWSREDSLSRDKISPQKSVQWEAIFSDWESDLSSLTPDGVDHGCDVLRSEIQEIWVDHHDIFSFWFSDSCDYGIGFSSIFV